MNTETFDEKIERLRCKLIVDEIVRRDGNRKYPELPHCSECFEGCEKCQPSIPAE